MKSKGMMLTILKNSNTAYISRHSALAMCRRFRLTASLYFAAIILTAGWSGSVAAGTVQATQYTTLLPSNIRPFLDLAWRNGSVSFVYSNYPISPGTPLHATLNWGAGSYSIMGVLGNSSYPIIQIKNNGAVLRQVQFPYLHVNVYSGTRSMDIDTTGLPAGPLEINFISFDGSSQFTVPGTPVSLNSAPTAFNKSLVLNEDGSGAVSLLVSDPDAGDTHAYGIASAPSVGSASISGSTLTYSPPANWSGTTSLTYAAVDSKGAWSNTATVTITVNPVNDAPVAQAKSITTIEDAIGTVTLSASDIDSPAPTVFQIVSGPDIGAATISGSTLNYTPPAEWSGSTSLTYIAQDSAGAWSEAVTVSISVNPVNDAPVAVAKSIITNEDTAGSVTLSATDIDSPVPTVFQVVSGPANGSASISGSTLTYTPPAEWSGSTSLTYRAQDSAGAWAAPVTVTITVNPVNDAPVAVAKSITTNEDAAGSVTLSVVDPDVIYGDSHTYELVGLSGNGTEVISGSTLTFTPAANWNGATSVTYRAKDEAGVYSAAVTVSITVSPVNDVPVAQAKTGITDEDNPLAVTLTATDIDSPMPNVFQIVSTPNATYGTAAISGSTLTFAPATNWNGTANMTYRAQDSLGAWSAAATVSISVSPINDVPVVTANKLILKTLESKSVTIKFMVSP
jgi:hypothetical protein